MWYVTASDKVWKDKIVVKCDTLDEARAIKEKWDSRYDLTYVSIRESKPSYKGRVSWYDKEMNHVYSTENGRVLKF